MKKSTIILLAIVAITSIIALWIVLQVRQELSKVADTQQTETVLSPKAVLP